MDFGQALREVRDGKKIARSGWNGKNMFIVYQKGYPKGIPANKNTAEAFGIEEKTIVIIRPYLQMYCADESLQMWFASQSDMLATDWEVL